MQLKGDVSPPSSCNICASGSNQKYWVILIVESYLFILEVCSRHLEHMPFDSSILPLPVFPQSPSSTSQVLAPDHPLAPPPVHALYLHEKSDHMDDGRSRLSTFSHWFNVRFSWTVESNLQPLRWNGKNLNHKVLTAYDNGIHQWRRKTPGPWRSNNVPPFFQCPSYPLPLLPQALRAKPTSKHHRNKPVLLQNCKQFTVVPLEHWWNLCCLLKLKKCRRNAHSFSFDEAGDVPQACRKLGRFCQVQAFEDGFKRQYQRVQALCT